MMQDQLTGGCLCGKVRYEAKTPYRSVHYCHCSMCRKATGSPFETLIWFPLKAVKWTATLPKTYQSSKIAERGFCADCGTPLFLQYKVPHRCAHEIALTVGSLDNPEDTVPEYHYGVESRLPWIDCSKGLPEKETQERL